MKKSLILSFISLSACSFSIYAGGETTLQQRIPKTNVLCYKKEFETYLEKFKDLNERATYVLELPKLNQFVRKISEENKLNLGAYVSAPKSPQNTFKLDPIRIESSHMLLICIEREFLLEKPDPEIEAAIRIAVEKYKQEPHR